MSIEDLNAALRATAPAPCTKFDCSKAGQCAAESLACSAFRHFVRSGAAVNPRFDVPLRVSRNVQPVWKDEPEPTAEIFQAVFSRSEVDEAPNAKELAEIEETLESTSRHALSSRSELERVW